MKLAPSDYVRRQIAITPFAGMTSDGFRTWALRAMDGVAEPVREKFSAGSFKALLRNRLAG